MKLLYPFRNQVRISQGFGNDLILDKLYTFNGVTYPAGSHFYKIAFGMDGHNGTDFACPIGTDVLASHDGFVTAHYDQGGYGNYIRLPFDEDGFGWQVIYGHLSEILKTGQVKAGDLIAKSGNSGTSTNPHCHFGLMQLKDNILLNGNNGFKGSINAAPFLEEESMTNSIIVKRGAEYGLYDPATSPDGLITLMRNRGINPPLKPDGSLDFAELDKMVQGNVV